MRFRITSQLALIACSQLIAFGAPAAEGPPSADAEAPSSSLMALPSGPAREGSLASLDTSPGSPSRRPPSALKGMSLFYVGPPDLPSFEVHDLVQIIVRETSTAKSKHELDAKKDFALDGSIAAWPDLRLSDLLNLQIAAGRTAGMPELKLDYTSDFKGEGEYERRDDLTARVTAEVIEVKPNGNLVLEARTTIQTDEEISTILITGVCRPDDITATNTIFSNQIHDLVIRKMHEGELKKSNEKGLIAKVLEFIFAF
ncbi:MAG: flagellar basal body L-ring protein FlgH [Phycisphaerales bacterium]|nr:MAG: flagellar basal body L-ring protein FlgH [Phycisphaerales bacterium]